MSDPFPAADRALASGRRICADCGARYHLAPGTKGEIQFCETCRSRRSRLIETLSDKFQMIAREIVPLARPEPVPLQRCTDCGKEFQANARGTALENCCEECHGRRVSLVDHIADQSFRGWGPRLGPNSRKRGQRKWVWVAAALIAITGGGFFAAPPAKKYYHHWREKRHVERAAAFFSKQDYKKAILDAKNALAFNSQSTEAIRIVAQSFDALHSPHAIEWRARLAQIVPNDLENSIGWAGAAIQAGDIPTADRILRNVPFEDHDTVRFHQLSALVALNKRDAVKAEFHWSEAAKLNPNEDAIKLNIANVRLKLGSTVERTNALELLKQLSLSSKERLPAMRALLSDALRHGEDAHARQLASALADDLKAPFSDKLLRLSTLRTLKDPDFALWRGRLEAEATDNVDYAYEMIIWMNRNGYAKDVPALLPRIREDFVSRPPVAIAVADSYAVARNWAELQKTLRGSKWGQMEYVRLGTLAWAMDQSGDRAGSAAVWKSAVAAAENRPERMETLARAATTWGWADRAEEVLWSIATSNVQSPTWVLQSLWVSSIKHGDTDRLRQLARMMLQANPKSVTVRNNYTFLSLLKRTEEGSPHQAAYALWTENPTNPQVVSTYALSLYQLNRAKAATDIMETLSPAQLREPAHAVYYGMFLAGSRRIAKAEEYLLIGSKWDRLLPEEEAMLDRVLQRLPSTNPKLMPKKDADPDPGPLR